MILLECLRIHKQKLKYPLYFQGHQYDQMLLNIDQLQDISKLKLSSCNKALKELNDLDLLNKELYKSLKLYSVKLENL